MADAPRILFVPVSGAFGTGEYGLVVVLVARLAIAAAMDVRWQWHAAETFELLAQRGTLIARQHDWANTARAHLPVYQKLTELQHA